VSSPLGTLVARPQDRAAPLGSQLKRRTQHLRRAEQRPQPVVVSASDWLGRKDSNLRSPDPESGAARRPAAAVLSQDSCSDPARAASSHVRFSGESGAHPGRESSAQAENRKNQVPTRERLLREIVAWRPSRCDRAIMQQVSEEIMPLRVGTAYRMRSIPCHTSRRATRSELGVTWDVWKTTDKGSNRGSGTKCGWWLAPPTSVRRSGWRVRGCRRP
jgi:hypothetical protein